MVCRGRDRRSGRLSSSGLVTTALSGIPRADVRRVQIPVFAIETRQLHGDAYRRFAEFEILILLAAEHSSDLARRLASGLANQPLEPEQAQEQVRPDGGRPRPGVNTLVRADYSQGATRSYLRCTCGYRR